MQMTIREMTIPGCFEISPRIFRDERGVFVKTFHDEVFQRHDLTTKWCEEFYSVSCRGVLRGLHFQLPAHEQDKLVYCTAGAVLDAALDLRRGSPSYGCHLLLEVSAEAGNMLYLPRGLAHGFYVLSESATLVYKVSSVYSPEHDAGILWNSAGILWPDDTPRLSRRDARFPTLGNFSSPFHYNGDRIRP